MGTHRCIEVSPKLSVNKCC